VNENLQPESPESGEEPAYAERDKAALEDKGALKPCEACGGDFAPLGLRSFVQTVNDDDTMRRGVGSTAAIAMCVNCGLMRFHSTTLLYLDEADDAAG
jgi:hypothetical protein